MYYCYMLRLTLIILSFLCFFTPSIAQGVGFQFYQGINKPMISFKDKTNSLSYKSSLNNDTKVGMWFGNLNHLSFSTLICASTVDAIYTSQNIISSFTHSSLLFDIPARYSFSKSPISSIAVGPSLGILMASSQTINGSPVRSEKIFTKINYTMLAEISFSGYSKDKLNLHPYILYRMMLNSADSDGDKLHINGLSFGLRLELSK